MKTRNTAPPRQGPRAHLPRTVPREPSNSEPGASSPGCQHGMPWRNLLYGAPKIRARGVKCSNPCPAELTWAGGRHGAGMQLPHHPWAPVSPSPHEKESSGLSLLLSVFSLSPAATITWQDTFKGPNTRLLNEWIVSVKSEI